MNANPPFITPNLQRVMDEYDFQVQQVEKLNSEVNSLLRVAAKNPPEGIKSLDQAKYLYNLGARLSNFDRVYFELAQRMVQLRAQAREELLLCGRIVEDLNDFMLISNSANSVVPISTHPPEEETTGSFVIDGLIWLGKKVFKMFKDFSSK
jgi:Txe/YoeB family toxin of Txe-Axe toxin-antitoxin module